MLMAIFGSEGDALTRDWILHNDDCTGVRSNRSCDVYNIFIHIFTNVAFVNHSTCRNSTKSLESCALSMVVTRLNFTRIAFVILFKF